MTRQLTTAFGLWCWMGCGSEKTLTVTGTDITASTSSQDVEDTSANNPENEPEDDVPPPCFDGRPNVMLYESRIDFETALIHQSVNVIDFEDVDTSGAAPEPIETDRYLTSHGVYIIGEDGQYVDDEFEWTSDYIPTSGTNMYAPGPIAIDAGGHTTDVHFEDNHCAYGLGVMFIDADFPELGPSGIIVYDQDGGNLGATPAFASESGKAIFRGLITVDDNGQPVKGIASGRITNGSVWPMSSCCDGVTLDDVMFGVDE